MRKLAELVYCRKVKSIYTVSNVTLLLMVAVYFPRQRSGSFSEEAEFAYSNGLELLLPISETKSPVTEQDHHDKSVK